MVPINLLPETCTEFGMAGGRSLEFENVATKPNSHSPHVRGTVVPGSPLIVGISALATAVDVNPWLLLVAATEGAIAGDGLSFWLGQRYHQEILLGWPLNRYPQFIGRSEAFINRYGVTRLQACFWLASQPLCAPLFRW